MPNSYLTNILTKKNYNKNVIFHTLRELIFAWIKFRGFREFGQKIKSTRNISKCAVREIESSRKITNFVIRENKS